MKRKSFFVVIAAVAVVAVGWAPSSASAQTSVSKDAGIAAFETVKAVFQHPRCQNCHIPGDAPLFGDGGARPHAMSVVRGPDGNGAPGLTCATCHGAANPPDAWGAGMPPGAPNWKLPPPQHKMVFIGLSSGDLCRLVKDPAKNGGKNFDALIKHVADDKLVAWGWNPGIGRDAVPIAHDEFVSKFKEWVAAGAPCAP